MTANLKPSFRTRPQMRASLCRIRPFSSHEAAGEISAEVNIVTKLKAEPMPFPAKGWQYLTQSRDSAQESFP
jgi:hypothetical protein